MAQLMTVLIATSLFVVLIAILWAFLFALLGRFGFPAPPRPALHENDEDHGREAAPPV